MEDQEKQYPQQGQQAANRARHASQCAICQHPERERIDHEYLTWCSPAEISERSGFSRYSLYRHIGIFGLDRQRRKNLTGAVERIIERLDITPVSGAVVLAAIRDLAKLNAAEEKLQQVQAAALVGRETGKERSEAEPLSASDAGAGVVQRPVREDPGQIANASMQ
jgi:hypothetical protein